MRARISTINIDCSSTTLQWKSYSFSVFIKIMIIAQLKMSTNSVAVLASTSEHIQIKKDISMKEENLSQDFYASLLCKTEDSDNEDWENPQVLSDQVKAVYQVELASRKKLQLVGIIALLLASKYEMFSPNIEDFIYITDNGYTSSQI
ncbi:hypothetical protein GH733_006807 [Mirounga leonina]|nr:hypothetical protein GH733_006807 [Mirounga leonina]